jgi:putative FmdB family regulatory protein
MPLYDYRCRGCGHTFEALVRNAVVPPCASCGGTDLEQLLSLFAVSSESTRQTNLQAARKKNSKVLRDKAIADREEIEHHHH